MAMKSITMTIMGTMNNKLLMLNSPLNMLLVDPSVSSGVLSENIEGINVQEWIIQSYVCRYLGLIKVHNVDFLYTKGSLVLRGLSTQ